MKPLVQRAEAEFHPFGGFRLGGDRQVEGQVGCFADISPTARKTGRGPCRSCRSQKPGHPRGAIPARPGREGRGDRAGCFHIPGALNGARRIGLLSPCGEGRRPPVRFAARARERPVPVRGGGVSGPAAFHRRRTLSCTFTHASKFLGTDQSARDFPGRARPSCLVLWSETAAARKGRSVLATKADAGSARPEVCASNAGI